MKINSLKNRNKNRRKNKSPNLRKMMMTTQISPGLKRMISMNPLKKKGTKWG